MRLPGYLRISRHNVFTFRRRVPRDLRQLLTFDELRCSLRTSDRRRAIKFSRLVALKTDFYFERVRMSRKKDQREEEMFRADLTMLLTKGDYALKLDFDAAKPGDKEEVDRQAAEFYNRAGAAQAAVAGGTTDATLDDLVKAFLSAPEVKERGQARGTVRKHADALALFQEVVGGNTPMRLVNQTCAVAYARRLRERELAANTRKNAMGSVSKFSRWVRGTRPECGHPVLDFVALRPRAEKRADEQRTEFTVEEVRRVLGAPELSKFRQPAPHKFWMPFIAAYSGLRVEEIAQLDPQEDFREEEGVTIMDVNDKGQKQLKNLTSRRVVPVHPVLRKLGLLGYVDGLRRAGARSLFPKQKARDGRLAKNPAKAVNRFIRETMKVPKTLHSFRHTVATMLKRKRVEESIAAALLGQAHGGITYARYGKAHLSEVLEQEAVRRISYGLGVEEGLTLS